MKVTVIIENKSYRENLLCQYGLSLFVETVGGTVLLDAGSDESAFLNFNNLGLSAIDIDAIVISHNHFDHFGGAPFFIENSNATVYISSAANNEYCVKSFLRRRQIVSRTEIIKKYPNRFHFVDNQTEILPGVYVCRIQNADKKFFCKDRRLKQIDEKGLLQDDFSHEVYLSVIEDGKCKILSSCSHNGIVNIISDAKHRFPDYPCTAFVGGLHMRGRKSNSINCTQKYADLVFSAVETVGTSTVYTGHCTGKKAYRLLRSHSRIDAHYFSTGDTFVL